MRYRCMLKAMLSLALLAGSSAYLQAAPKTWEPVKAEHAEAKSIAKDTDLEIKTTRGKLIVSTTKPTQIKVVTILGRTICSDTVQAGNYQLNLAHGVYLVKVGELTLKVAL